MLPQPLNEADNNATKQSCPRTRNPLELETSAQPVKSGCRVVKERWPLKDALPKRPNSQPGSSQPTSQSSVPAHLATQMAAPAFTPSASSTAAHSSCGSGVSEQAGRETSRMRLPGDWPVAGFLSCLCSCWVPSTDAAAAAASSLPVAPAVLSALCVWLQSVQASGVAPTLPSGESSVRISWAVSGPDLELKVMRLPPTRPVAKRKRAEARVAWPQRFTCERGRAGGTEGGREGGRQGGLMAAGFGSVQPACS